MSETQRRLAAVAFADVAGWSRLIEQNDVQTLRAWKGLQGEVLEPTIRAYRGRLLEVAGDSVLVEFPSAVAAVGWALDVQRQSHDQWRKNEGLRLTLRIGINVEDVIVDGDKLVGDGVNIASRIHQLAEPGEIIVTSAVKEYVANKIHAAFSDLGVRALKNISRRIQLYRVERGQATPLVQEQASARMGADEPVRTLLAVEAASARAPSHWREMLSGPANTVLAEHGGRVVGHLEHGVLLGFAHAPHAAKAAFDIQQLCENALRMGMQVSELVAHEAEEPSGDTTLASRLTALAKPGEIVVSAEVRDQLIPVLDADIEDLGDCYVKSLAEPVRAYRIDPPGPQSMSESLGALLELRPTLAIIPFVARSLEPEHHVLGEVLADRLISALSRRADMNVISRLSTTAFRGRDATLEEIRGHLHADYVLSGAYHVTGSKFSLMAELAETKSARVVWMEETRGELAGVVSGRDVLIDSLTSQLSAAVSARETQKAQTQPLPTLESYTLLIAAISLMHRLSRQDFNRARELLETLVLRTPRHAVPYAWLAKWHVLRVWQGWAATVKEDAAHALDCTKRALDVDPECSLALAIDGFVHTNLLKDLDTALSRYDLALRVNPNDSLAYLLKGTLHAFRGEGKQAIKDSQHALRLSPLDPHRYFYDSLAATAALGARRYDRAIALARRSLRANRTHASTLRALTIGQWQAGRHEEARKTAAELMKVEPTLTVQSYLERHPAADYETGKEWADALGRAGVPQGK